MWMLFRGVIQVQPELDKCFAIVREVLIIFSKYVGVCDSNEVEVLDILRLFSSRYGGAYYGK